MSVFDRRKFLTVSAASAGLVLAGCSQRAGSDSTSTASGSSGAAKGFPEGSFIGVALPQKTSQNWQDAQVAFPKALKAAGFKSQVQFANGGVAEQQGQITSLITKGAKVLIIGAIDGSQLGSQLAQAKAAGIPVISYDRLITNSADVDYLVTFQPTKVGELQGESLLKGMTDKAGHPAPFNIELFAGSPDDNNAKIFFEGAMKKLQPMIDSGDVVVPSGQVSFQQVATKGWDPKEAQSRMDAILQANYGGDTVLDGVLSPNDTIARALITSIKNAGKKVPPMTGQDSDVASIALIFNEVQYSTIDKPTQKQVDAAVKMVVALSKGDKPETNGKSNNGKTDIPTDFLAPTLVTKENLAEVYKGDPVREPAATTGKG